MREKEKERGRCTSIEDARPNPFSFPFALALIPPGTYSQGGDN